MILKDLLKENVTTVSELTRYLPIAQDEIARLDKIASQFPFSVHPYYLSLIDISDPNDPIRKMSIPDLGESDVDGSFDTSGEVVNTVLSGVQHKYKATALILSTSACAMYCRHCFRKRLVGMDHHETSKNRAKVIEYIQDHPEISNVLISGGDALLNPTPVLKEYLNSLSQTEHLDTIRICSRTPVVLPMRIYNDKELLDILKSYSQKKSLYLITQFNHPRELTKEALRAVNALEECGVTIRNQTVLLKGVNDNADTLGTLLRSLVRSSISPYYVFQCRPVTGVKKNFQVPFDRAYDIVEKAKSMQSGLGKSFRYVLSHETGKIEILGPVSASNWLFKYHQAKSDTDAGRIFITTLNHGQCWLTEDNVRRSNNLTDYQTGK